MIETCSHVASINYSLLNKCLESNQRVLEETLVNLSHDINKKICKKNQFGIQSSHIYSVRAKPLWRKSAFLKFANKIIFFVLKFVCCSMSYFNEQQENINKFSSNVAQKILDDCLSDIKNSLDNQYQNILIENYVEKLVQNTLFPIVEVFENGILKFSEVMSQDIVSSSIAVAAQQIETERVANIFAEKFSLRIFRDFFIHIITDGNRIAYHLIGSYQAVSKNQLRTFAENIVVNIMDELFPHKQQEIDENELSISEFFASSLADDILISALNDIEKMKSINKPKQSVKKSDTSIHAIEKYADQMVQGFFMDIPVLNVNNKSASTRSSVCLKDTIRRESYDEQSDAVSPRSAVGENNWKKGIYYFADQLLYSLTALETEDSSDTLSELGDPVRYRRERRWGSCPHIYQKPFGISKELSAWRRKSETIVIFTKNVVTYAENLADSILSSVLPSTGKNKFVRQF